MNKLAKPPNLTLIRDRTPLIAVTLILPFARCTQECLLNRPKTFPVKSTRRHSIEPAGDFTKQTPRQEQPSTAICVYVWVHIRVWVFGCVDVSDLFGNIQVKMLQYYSEKQNMTYSWSWCSNFEHKFWPKRIVHLKMFFFCLLVFVFFFRGCDNTYILLPSLLIKT